MLEPFSGNEKMVIAVPNDKINYCNLFVVLPLMNRRVTLKLSFERDSNRISALSRKPQLLYGSALMSLQTKFYIKRRITSTW